MPENQQSMPENFSTSDFMFLSIVAACTAGSLFGVMVLGYAFYRLQKHLHDPTSEQVDYPRYGVTGPSKLRQEKQKRPERFYSDPRLNQLVSSKNFNNNHNSDFDADFSAKKSGKLILADMDAKLASSAQLFHYQQTKKQLLAMNRPSIVVKQNEECSESDTDSERGGVEGSVSVYECPGLATIANVELTNPLFQSQPASPVMSIASRDHRAEVLRHSN